MRFIILLVSMFSLFSSTASAQEYNIEQRSTSSFFVQAGVRAQSTFGRALATDSGLIHGPVVLQVGPEIGLGIRAKRLTLATFYSLIMGNDEIGDGAHTTFNVGFRGTGHVHGPLHIGGFGYVSSTKIMGVPNDLGLSDIGANFGIDLSLVTNLGETGRLQTNVQVGCGPSNRTINAYPSTITRLSPSCSAGLSVQVGLEPKVFGI